MFFENIPQADPDPVFGLVSTYNQDKRFNKVDLMVGVFKNEKLEKKYIPSVKAAEKIVIEQEVEADYLPIDGLPGFVQGISGLIFQNPLLLEKIYGAQTVGAIGALRIGAEFIKKFHSSIIYVPNPTYANHAPVFEKAGLEVKKLNYFDALNHKFDFQNFTNELDSIPNGSVVLFHPCCHNPTGCDPALEEWKEIANLCKKKSLLSFFDFAYQGFANGIDNDAEVIRYFCKNELNMLVAYSCSKNFTLYSQRVGALFVVCDDQKTKINVGSQIKKLIRSMYSNPPSFGAKIVQTILQDPKLLHSWKQEVDQMRERIFAARKLLKVRLEEKASDYDFSFLDRDRGLFTYLNLSFDKVEELRERFGIYTSLNGRINVCGITDVNVDYFVECLMKVLIR